MKRAARASAAGFALALAAACAPAGPDPSKTEMQPLRRFAAPAGAAPPTAAIGDDTRPVLKAPGPVTLQAPRVPVGDGGKLRVEAPLPPSYARVSDAVGSLTVFAGGQRHSFPRQLHRFERRAEGRVFVLDVTLPPELAGEARVGFALHGFGVPEQPASRFETAPTPIPAGSRLELSVGLVDPEIADGATSFEVSACEGDTCVRLLREDIDPRDAAQRGWQTHRVPLDAFAGRTRRFRFEATRTDGRPALPVWGNPTLYAPAPREPDAHNVLLISVDTLRADHLPSYGYGRDTAPFLDEHLARGGTLFETMVAASTVTAPSHMTMFTGLQPSGHGVTDGLRRLPRSIRTVPEELHARGISTAAFTENGWVGVHQGFARGFDRFVENKSAEIMIPRGQVDVTFAQGRRWLEENRDKRFFLFLHTYQVHEPYAPPERYAGLFPELPEDAEPHLRAMADYDREIRYVDDELRGLMQALDEAGLAERTVVVLTSDHGEEFMEHGLMSHGGHLYEETVRVPLLLRGPGIPAGRRVTTPVAQADLMPTLLELFGVPGPDDRDAYSLLDLVHGGTPDHLARRALFSEGLVKFQGGRGGGRSFDPPTTAVRVGNRKLHRDREKGEVRHEHYDLARDPLERRNLLEPGAPLPDDLKALLDRYPGEREAERLRLGDGSQPRQEAPPIDPERREKLRALGYLE